MPVYCYVHPDTSEVIEHVAPMSDIPERIDCGGVMADRCRAAEYACQGGMRPATWPMFSNALGVSSKKQQKEYVEHAKRMGEDISFDSRGRMELRSKTHRARVARIFGMTDFDGGYGDPRTD